MKPNMFWLVPPVALGTALILPAIGEAYFTPHPTAISKNFDWWMNYDFDSQDTAYNNVDFPMTMIWGSEGQIDDVKDYMTGNHGWSRGGNTKYTYLDELNNTNSPQWDNDQGIKGICAAAYGEQLHTRLYAPTDGYFDDQFYNTTWAYYIVATTHIDRNHSGCGSGVEAFGWSEAAEDRILQYADDHHIVDPDRESFQNYGYGYYDFARDHYHQSDGLASVVGFKA